MKVTVVGAGAVGASCAEYIAMKNFCSEVVLVDIKEGFAEGKAMDLMQTASLNGFDTKITGTTGDYSKTAGSHVAVITSGIPRKPGMTREELIGINLPEEKIALLDAIRPQYIILKPSLHGGFSGTKEWIELADSRNIPWWITSALESNIGLNAIAQFTAEYHPALPQGLGTGGLYETNFDAPLTIENGYLHYSYSL